MTAGAVGVAAIVAAALPITLMPYSGDDLVNRNWALKSWSSAFTESTALVQQWMQNEGRFFPTAAGYGVVVWETFTSRTSYTGYLTFLAIVLGCSIAYSVWRYTGRLDTGAVSAFAFACGIQFRFFYDGFTSFAGLVPFSLLMTVGATACAFAVWRGRTPWLALASGLMWGLAITAYEVSLLMLPALLLLIIARPPASVRARWVALASLAIPAALDIAIVAWLRLHLAVAPAPGYTIAVTGATPKTAMHQFVGAIPLSQHLFAIAPSDHPLLTALGIALAVIFAAATAYAFRRSRHEGFARSHANELAMAAAGLWAWIVPSALAGITSRWQTELPINQGYIYVVYESAGVCLLTAAAYLFLTGRVGDPGSRRIALTFAVALAIAAALTAGTNLDFARHLPSGPEGPDWPAAGGPS